MDTRKVLTIPVAGSFSVIFVYCFSRIATPTTFFNFFNKINKFLLDFFDRKFIFA